MSENEVKVTNQEFNGEPETSGKHYVGVMFESKYGSTKENPKFYGKVYTYATEKDLKEGQVITIDTNWGQSRVCVIKENIDPDTIDFDINLIKEI